MGHDLSFFVVTSPKDRLAQFQRSFEPAGVVGIAIAIYHCRNSIRIPAMMEGFTNIF
ncbi:MAG: hypothetical protein HPY66_0027 [Firmicutes bacterium]|nr:hypothetical protein [Bacillota bacterium]